MKPAAQKFSVFDQRFANCGNCELKQSCDRQQFSLAAGPSKPFNNIFIVGEFPGQQEVNAKRPFVGRPGQLLRSLLRSAGIDMDACYLSNALLAKPPVGEGKILDRFPNAVHSCLSRLEKEIEHVKPRVIIALGPVAFAALTGYEESKQKRVHFTCENHACGEDRRIGPLFQCGKCKATFEDKHVWPEGADQDEATCTKCGMEALALCVPTELEDNLCTPPMVCPWCSAKTGKLKPKKIKCPSCNGLKTRETTIVTFEQDYSLKEAAGMVVPGDKFGWSDLEVKYIIPTFHPSFLLIPTKSEGSGEKKVMAGQFAAYAVQKHFEKARVLAAEDRKWSFEYDVTAGDGEEAAKALQSFFDDVLATKEYELGTDVETEAWGCAHYCDVCGKKSRETKNRNFVEGSKSLEPCQTEANCGLTEHTLETCELDARELEEVTKIKCIGFASNVLRRAVVVDTRDMKLGSPLHKKLIWALAEQPELGLVFHHGTYDIPVIKKLWNVWPSNYTSDTLIKHHETHADETHDLAHLAARYTFAPMWKPPKKKRGAVIHESFDELCEYNARDCIVTAEASHMLDLELKREKMTKLHEIDMELQAQGLNLQQNGLPLDRDAARIVGQEAFELQQEGLAEMRAALGGVRYTCKKKSCTKCRGTGIRRIDALPCEHEFNPNSGEHMRDAIYVKLGNAVGSWTKGGKKKIKMPSVDKDAIAKITDGPFKRAAITYKENSAIIKAFFEVEPTGKLDELGEPVHLAEPGRSLNLWADGRAHFAWKPFGTVTGRFSSSPNCFSGDTEVLTRNGWVRFDAIGDAHEDVEVMQYHDDGSCSFVRPSDWVEKHFRGSLASVSTTATQLLVTPDHDCLLRNRKTNALRVFKASEYPEDWQQIHAGVFGGGDLSLDANQIAILCATQADGHYTKGHQVIFAFKKARKCDRLRNALTALAVPFRESTQSSGHTSFTIQRVDTAFIEPFLKNKQFTWEVLSLNRAALDLFCLEVFLWDGHTYVLDRVVKSREGAATYSSSIKQNTDVVQAALSLSGRRSKIREYKSHAAANVNYQVDSVMVDYSLTTNRKVASVLWDDFVYCLTVPTNHVMIRRNGRIMVTNQCQNIPKWFRAMFKCKPGRKIVGADYDQLEFRTLAVLCGDETLIHKCMTADDKRKLEPDFDPHSYVASNVFDHYESLLLKDPRHDKENNKCKCETCHRKNLRDLCKRVIYGLNYGAGEDVVLASIHKGGYYGPPIGIDDIRAAKKTIFEVFPGILMWRQDMVKMAQETRELRSVFTGRRREFALGEIPITEIANFSIQSSSADIVNERGTLFYNIHKDLDPSALYLAQIHDALYYEVDEGRAEVFAAAMTKTLTCEKSFGGSAPMKFSASASIADNMKDAA